MCLIAIIMAITNWNVCTVIQNFKTHSIWTETRHFCSPQPLCNLFSLRYILSPLLLMRLRNWIVTLINLCTEKCHTFYESNDEKEWIIYMMAVFVNTETNHLLRVKIHVHTEYKTQYQWWKGQWFVYFVFNSVWPFEVVFGMSFYARQWENGKFCCFSAKVVATMAHVRVV